MNSDLSWSSRHTYYVIGQYNYKREYIVHRFYICSNMKSPIIEPQYNELEDCFKTNPIMSSSSMSSSFVLSQ